MSKFVLDYMRTGFSQINPEKPCYRNKKLVQFFFLFVGEKLFLLLYRSHFLRYCMVKYTCKCKYTISKKDNNNLYHNIKTIMDILSIF